MLFPFCLKSVNEAVTNSKGRDPQPLLFLFNYKQPDLKQAFNR